MTFKRPTLTRRAALAAAGAVALAAPTRISAQPKLTSLTIASSPNVDMVTILYAQKAGVFAKNGLDVNLFKMDNGTATAAALVGGSMDIGKISAGPIIVAHTKGIDMPIVFPDKIRVPGPVVDTGMLVAADSPVKTGRDLNDQVISCGALQDTTWISARAWIDKTGGDSSTVKFIEIPLSAVVAALTQNRIAAGTVTEPYTTAGVKSGKARLLADVMDAIGGRVLQAGWCCTPAYAKAHPDIIARFVEAMRAAAAYCNVHRDEVAQLAAAYTGLDLALVDSMQVTFATSPDPNELQPWIDAYAKYKVIPQRFAAGDLFLHA